jgi:hypothetical protein
MIERKGTSTCLSIKLCLFPSFLSRCACSLPFYQDVRFPFLSIKMCLFPSFLSKGACYVPFCHDVLNRFLCQDVVTSTSWLKGREQGHLISTWREQAHLDGKESNKHILIERKGTSRSMCLLLSLLSRCACSRPFYQDVIVPFLSINARCACYLPLYQDVLVPQAHLDGKESNKHILIERKGTSRSW